MNYIHINIGKKLVEFGMFRAKLNKTPQFRSLSLTEHMYRRTEDGRLSGKGETYQRGDASSCYTTQRVPR